MYWQCMMPICLTRLHVPIAAWYTYTPTRLSFAWPRNDGHLTITVSSATIMQKQTHESTSAQRRRPCTDETGLKCRRSEVRWAVSRPQSNLAALRGNSVCHRALTTCNNPPDEGAEASEVHVSNGSCRVIRHVLKSRESDYSRRSGVKPRRQAVAPGRWSAALLR